MPDTVSSGTAAPPSPSGTATRTALAAGWVAALTLALYAPVLANGFVNWDDPFLILNNPHVRGFHPGWAFSTFFMGHYQPLALLSFSLDGALWDLRPAGVHLTTLLLYAATAGVLTILLARFVRRLYADRERPAPEGAIEAGAALAALVWAAHPLRVESVAWATERRSVLAVFFLALALLGYLRADGDDGRPRRGRHGATLCFALSLFSMALGVMLPFALLLWEALRPRRTPGQLRRAAARLAPWMALSAVFAVLAVRAQHAAGALWTWSGLPPADRLGVAAGGLWFYLFKLMAPIRLSPLYRLPEPLADWRPLLVVAALAAAIVAAVLVRQRRRRPGWPAAAGAAAVLILPLLGLAQSGPQFAADRYTLLASWPLAAGLACAIAVALASARRAIRIAAGAGLAAWILALAVLSRAQMGVWRDSETLWTHALRLDPNNVPALVNRAHARTQAGDVRGAADDYERALTLAPGNDRAWNGRGSLRLAAGDTDGAREDVEQALRLNPRNAEAWNNHGSLRQLAGDWAGALADHDEALRLAPGLADAWFNRGRARHRLGDRAGARADLAQALMLDPAITNRAAPRSL